MPYTVYMSFEQFREKQVDLAANETGQARTSRDYLQEQIRIIAASDPQFPRLLGHYQSFGSFARKTKIRPLDDIDMLVLLSEAGTSLYPASGYSYNLLVHDPLSPLWQLTDANGYLNSTKLLNKFKSSLGNVPNYRKADIKRTGEAVVLDLSSYSWAFDIIPAFRVMNVFQDVDSFLIPDGYGHWKKTDPRRDKIAVSDTNRNHSGWFIPLVRLIKYWNVKSYAVPRLNSYYLETMLISAYRCLPPITSLRRALPDAFKGLAQQITRSCPDPHGFGPALDSNMTQDVREKIREVAESKALNALVALRKEDEQNHKEAITWWGYVFPDFPAYGS